MQQRQLGRSGLRVPAVGLGCMGLSGMYGAVDAAAMRLVDTTDDGRPDPGAD